MIGKAINIFNKIYVALSDLMSCMIGDYVFTMFELPLVGWCVGDRWLWGGGY